jgi:hypothetical protein
VGFKGKIPEGRVDSYKGYCMGFLYTSIGLRGDTDGYSWVREGKVMQTPLLS